MSHRCTGITRRRRQNGDRFVAADVGQHLRHKAPAEIFKRQRRAVEQLQTADVWLNGFHRCREGKRSAHARFQQFVRNFIANKSREDFRAAADEILLQHFIDFRQAKLRQIMRKKQPLIFAQPLSHRLREAHLLVMIFKIVEFHRLSQYSCAGRVQTANMNKAFLILQVVFR
ncbi:hypothetical protein D3C71_742210 [compost metagenome]